MKLLNKFKIKFIIYEQIAVKQISVIEFHISLSLIAGWRNI